MIRTRRNFLTSTAAVGVASTGKILGANDRVRTGVIGVGGRGMLDARCLEQVSRGSIVAAADVYEPRLDAARAAFAGIETFKDYRKLLDRKDVDAVIIGTPDHWHVPMLVDALKAGKDVYVEKPVSHSLEEHAKARAAFEGSGRVVQVGYQNRSTDWFKKGKSLLDSGQLGKVTLIVTHWHQNYLATQRDFNVQRDKLDWKSWLGPAKDQPFDATRWARWRWFWDFGNGALTDLFSHWIDTVHWYMGEAPPTAIQAIGRKSVFHDWECPDTVSSTYDYRPYTVTFAGAMYGSVDGGGLVFRGTKATLKVSREGLMMFPEGARMIQPMQMTEPDLVMWEKRDGTVEHMQNFVDCIRNRSKPNSDLQSALLAAEVSHLGNRAMLSGKTWRTNER